MAGQQLSERAIYGYARVSTIDQAENGVSLDGRRRIEGRCMEECWQLSEMFIEKDVSGSMPLALRPEGGRLLGMLKPGDIVIAAKLDRVFRSARDALNVIEDLRSRKVSLWMLDVGDCSGNGISQLVITIMAAVADFERDRIGQRIREGKASSDTRVGTRAERGRSAGRLTRAPRIAGWCRSRRSRRRLPTWGRCGPRARA
jgi:putative DNA-invertase from lambdoid prophage Rac